LEAFLETIFQYLCQCSHHFCGDFLGRESLSFQNTFRYQKQQLCYVFSDSRHFDTTEVIKVEL
jgi:hypothetical protein